MEYFVLNEYSLPKDRMQEKCLVQFFNLYTKAVQNNFKEIRVSENIDSNWYQTPISQNRTIRNWIDEQDFDYSIRLKGLISSTTAPIFQVDDAEKKESLSLCDFIFDSEKVPVLGAVYLLKQLSLSFYTNEKWNDKHLKLSHEEYIGDDISKNEIKINNVTNIEHWNFHFDAIKKIRKEIELSNKNFTKFNHIVFISDALRQLKKESNLVFISKLWDCCYCLNEVIEGSNDCLSFTYLLDKTFLDMVDESDTVKQNPKKKRELKKVYNGKLEFFGYHIRGFIDQKRVHFIIKDNKVVIGYLGKHL